MFKLNKNDYFLSGAVESALVFYDTATIGAARAVGEEAVILQENSLCRFYIGKKGIIKAKNELLKLPVSVVQENFINWRKKWETLDPVFYQFATHTLKNWETDWQKLNEICENFWFDSYKVECLDSFGEEFNRELNKGLKEKKINTNYLHDLIAPQKPTIVQQAILDQVKLGEAEYLKKYWYCLGSWKGGGILAPRHLESMHSDTLPNFDARKQLHQSLDPILDEKTLHLVKILRIFALWREERKTFLQRITLAYQNILRSASKDLRVDYEILIWTRFHEASDAKTNSSLFSKRKNQSVYFLQKGSARAQILVDDDAKEIIDSFKAQNKVRKIEGTVASRGNVIGLVKKILKEHHFYRFNEGDILVTTMTRPEYLPLMKKASAIVTDEGGLTSHAAIVARELKKPCIIGTKVATQILNDGDRAEVDANNGVIKILEK